MVGLIVLIRMMFSSMKIFTERELSWLDDCIPEDEKAEKESKKWENTDIHKQNGDLSYNYGCSKKPYELEILWKTCKYKLCWLELYQKPKNVPDS